MKGTPVKGRDEMQKRVTNGLAIFGMLHLTIADVAFSLVAHL